jgi:hypothetical protein
MNAPIVARALPALALLCCIASGDAWAVAAPTTATADVLIQAGHEGRPDCAVEPASLCNNTGAPGEIRWTPIVADVATKTLRAAGISVLRMPAYLVGPYRVKDAIFIHFDGAGTPCTSGPSVGYPAGTLAKYGPHSAQAAQQWKQLYGAVVPFRFEADNFTPTLRDYYGYHRIFASDASLVIEGSEITCPAQHAWQASHLQYEGRLIAYFISRRLGLHTVSHP